MEAARRLPLVARHPCIEQLIIATTVSKRLGHANVHVTATVYSHALPEDEAAAAQIWNQPDEQRPRAGRCQEKGGEQIKSQRGLDRIGQEVRLRRQVVAHNWLRCFPTTQELFLTRPPHLSGYNQSTPEWLWSQETGWAPMRSLRPSVGAEWARCTRRAIHVSIGSWRSRFYARTRPTIQRVGCAFSRKPRPLRHSTTPIS